MGKTLKWFSIVLASLVATWFIAALVMVALPAPTFARPNGLEITLGADLAGSETASFTMRDGVELHAVHFPASDALTVVFIHGVMSDSREYEYACAWLHRVTGADVYAIDIRGHGRSGGRPGDISYRDQYEDDIADVLASLRKKNPSGALILAGHSMGGGVAMRYAELHEMPQVDGYLLFAPHLGISSPTTPTTNVPLAPGQESPVKLNLPRILGLLMLNVAGVHALDGQNTLFFNAPPSYPIHSYSFRAMVSMSPNDFHHALTADAAKMFVIVGSRDEAFVASQYPRVVKEHRNGSVFIVPGVSHDGVVHSPVALGAASRWLQALRSRLAESRRNRTAL